MQTWFGSKQNGFPCDFRDTIFMKYTLKSRIWNLVMEGSKIIILYAPTNELSRGAHDEQKTNIHDKCNPGGASEKMSFQLNFQSVQPNYGGSQFQNPEVFPSHKTMFSPYDIHAYDLENFFYFQNCDRPYSGSCKLECIPGRNRILVAWCQKQMQDVWDVRAAKHARIDSP